MFYMFFYVFYVLPIHPMFFVMFTRERLQPQRGFFRGAEVLRLFHSDLRCPQRSDRQVLLWPLGAVRLCRLAIPRDGDGPYVFR